VCRVSNLEKELFSAGEPSLDGLKHSLYFFLVSFTSFVISGFDIDVAEPKFNSIGQSSF